MYKLLLADDEPIILKGLSNLIDWDDLGIELFAAANNGKEAISILNSTAIDILITDIRMPELDGLQLIRHIRNNNLNIRCIVLSGYNEFDYVKKAAQLGIENYILKPVDKYELTSTLINTVNKIENDINRKIIDNEGIEIIRNNILTRWVRGDIEDDDLHERSSILDIDIFQKEYLIALVKYMLPSSIPIKAKSEHNVQINNICSSVLAQMQLGMSFMDNNSNTIVLFSGNNLNARKDDIHLAVNEIINRTNQVMEGNVFLTIGSIEKSYHEVYKSYHNAHKLLEYSLINSKNTAVYYDDVMGSGASVWKKNLTIDYNILNNAIKDKNTIIVQAFVKDIFFRLKQISLLSSAQLQNITIDLLFYIINTIRTLNYNTDKVFNGYMEMLSYVNKFNNIDDMSCWMDEIVIKCMDILSIEDDKISPMVKRVKDYINHNYASEINISTISSEFNINSFYLGQQFKKETDETLTSYLNKIRIEQAKHLLLSGNMKTIDIAKKVGYSNTNYFSTIFKKVTGYSPSEFRDES